MKDYLIERNENWVINHEKIKKAYLEFWEENDCRPTATEIAKITGVSKPTAGEHIRELQLNDVALAERKYSNDVLKGIRTKAMSGDAPAAKLWLQVVNEWAEKKEIKHNITKQTLSISFTDPIPEKKKDEKEVEHVIVEEKEEQENNDNK